MSQSVSYVYSFCLYFYIFTNIIFRVCGGLKPHRGKFPPGEDGFPPSFDAAATKSTREKLEE